MNSSFTYLAKMALMIAVIVAAIHVATSALAAAFASYYYKDRIFDVHRLGDRDDEAKLMSAYIKSKVTGDLIVAAGSSFTFSYPFDETHTFTAELNRRRMNSINVSATGFGTLSINNQIICALREDKVRIRAVIIEIPLINEITSLRNARQSNLITNCPPQDNAGLFMFALTHPLGTGWVYMLRDQFRKVSPNAVISLGAVPDSYLPTKSDLHESLPALESNIAAIYRSARSISDNVIMFVTPVFYAGVTRVGRDADTVRAQFEAVQALCVKIAGTNCLDTSPLIAEKNFANITHFNSIGAKTLADLIAPKIIR